MGFVEGYVDNDNVKIHYLDNEINNIDKAPLLICPGLSESAEDYIALMEKIKDRRCIALSFRGRGKSDAPLNRYTLENHITDIEAVVKELKLDKFNILGNSRGVSYCLRYAISNNDKLDGIIIGEYPPVHKKMSMGWAKKSMEFYKEHCDSISITYEVLSGIEKESSQVEFSKELKNITCKALILKGELEESLLNDKDIENYLNNLGSNDIRVERFYESGHDIQSEEFDKLSKLINEFLEGIN